jgi:hypothetical protein
MTEEPTAQDDPSASSLLEAVVHAELELRDLENTCVSLEEVISLGRASLAAAEEAGALVPEALQDPLRDTTKAAEVRSAPMARAAAEPPAPGPAAVETKEPAAIDASLEEQAAALRAAMAEDAPVARSVPRPAGDATPEGSGDASHPAEDQPDRRPFQPKRTSPLKSRLAREGEEDPTREGESFSARSAELEQLLRSENAPN